MANPVQFEGQNTTFVAKGCGDLPAHVGTYEGTREIVTAWQLSPEELQQVQENGGIVFLRCVGLQPPVKISTFNLIEEDG